MNEKVKFWLMKAFEDWKVLEVEMKLPENEISTSAVCFHFHSQQFVEKLLKAYLTMKKIPFDRTHVLEVLLESCKTQDKDFSSLDLKNLSKYAVEIRYPDELYIPSLEEARECFEIASKSRKLVLRKLGVEEKEVLEWIKEWMEK